MKNKDEDQETSRSSDLPRQSGSVKSYLFELFALVVNVVCGVDITDTESSVTPENPITDFDHDVWTDFKTWRLSSVVIYQVTFLVLIVYFIVSAYTEARTKSFITLDKTSGVCKDDSSSKYCCEVPQTITGTFLADTRGRWNTQNNFSYVNNNYAVTVSGLEYTNAQWADVMKNITVQLSNVGLKGENRDLAWNMIAWSAFTAQNLDRGFLQFYATGSANIMFDKPIVNAGVASAASQKKQCAQAMDLSYSATDSYLDVSIGLCDSPDGLCDNPCPDILAPQAMGYDPFLSQENTLDLRISMQAVATALAVNLGMITLNHLVMVPGDNARITLLDEMVRQGAIDAWTANHTSSYFDQLHAPTPPIYCFSANTPVQDSNTWLSGNAFCMVRVGNTLTYPVTTSYGWSADGTSYPTQCTKSATKQDGSAAKFYCNKFDVNVGLIYYPVPNLNTSITYTFAPSRSPTQRPTPPPGAPTIFPTTAPTNKPTRLPSQRPTPPPGAPTCAPTTHKPSRRPSAAPTTRPSNAPISTPTWEPTVHPSAEPSAEPTAARRRMQTDNGTDDAAAGDDAAATYYDDAAATYYDDAADDFGFDDDGFDDDGGAADDQYATTGIGTYSNPYYANSATDDFQPLIPDVVDNGLIFALGKFGAAQLNKVNFSNGDLAISNNAYFAMVDTVVGTLKDKSRGFKKDFNRLCSSSADPSIAEGCAMMAFNFDGENSRDISNYFYQPSSTPAFSNTLYIKNEMITLQKNTPTSLIQTYYSCVLAPWPALLAAVGIGSSSAGAFVTVGFAFYVFCTLLVLNKFFGANIPSKKAMAAAVKAEQDLREQEVEVMRAVVAALRVDVQSGRVNLPSVSQAFEATTEDLKKAQTAAERKAIRRQGGGGGGESGGIELNPMASQTDNTV